MKSKNPIFAKSVIGLLFTIALGYIVFLRADKSKDSFQNINGIVTSVNRSHIGFPNKDSLKYRYLKIDKFYKTFELFIGKGVGDFKPKFEKVDVLKEGDSISIYFDENNNTQNDPINRLT